MVSGARNIQRDQATIVTAETLAEQYAKILGTPLTGNPTQAQLQQLQKAVAFFQAMENGGSFTTSSGQVINFNQFKGGIFGNKTAGFITSLNKVLADYGGKLTIQVPSTCGRTTTATVMDANGKPATLAEIIENPNEKFTFQYDCGVHFFNGSVNWTNKNPSGVDGTVTQDKDGNTIPGGGLTFHQDETCTSNTMNVTGTGTALVNYLNFSPNSNASADGDALGKYVHETL